MDENSLLLNLICPEKRDWDLSFSGNINWNIIFGKAFAHKMAPIVYSNLVRYEWSALIPGKVLSLFEKAYRRTAEKTRKLLHEYKLIRQEASARGVRLVPLKGIVFANDLYDDPYARYMSDVDILIPLSEKKKMENLLFNLDYRSDEHEAVLERFFGQTHYRKPLASYLSGILSIDLHTKLFISSPMQITYERLKKMFLIYKQDDREFLIPEASVLLLIDTLAKNRKAIHRGRPYPDISISQLLDLALFLNQNRIDWDRFWGLAEEFDLMNASLFCLFLVDRFFETAVPAMVQKKLDSRADQIRSEWAISSFDEESCVRRVMNKLPGSYNVNLFKREKRIFEKRIKNFCGKVSEIGR